VRIDKVDPGVGNFRGTSKFDVAEEHWNVARGVGMDANGLSEIGPSVSGLQGLTIYDKTTRRAGSRIDIMTVGEIVDLGPGFSAGQKVYVANATGFLSAVAGNAAAPAASTFVGWVMDDLRLVVRFALI
jgi:hypothetical protein